MLRILKYLNFMLHSNSMKRIYILLSFSSFSAAHAQITITVDDLATGET